MVNAATPAEWVVATWEERTGSRLSDERLKEFKQRPEFVQLLTFEKPDLHAGASRAVRRNSKGHLLLADWLHEARRSDIFRSQEPSKPPRARSVSKRRRGERTRDAIAAARSLEKQRLARRQAIALKKGGYVGGNCQSCGRPYGVDGRCGCS